MSGLRGWRSEILTQRRQGAKMRRKVDGLRMSGQVSLDIADQTAKHHHAFSNEKVLLLRERIPG